MKGHRSDKRQRPRRPASRHLRRPAGHRSGRRSIYVRFSLVFLAIWWALNAVTFVSLKLVLEAYGLVDTTGAIGRLMGFAFFSSGFMGTGVILVAVRGVVKPIRSLSDAARRVATGDLDARVPVRGGDEVAQLCADFNTMMERLGALDALRRDFVSNVSHEFRTPLASIRGYTQLLAEPDVGPGQRAEMAAVAVGECDRLIDLSSDLLRLSELDAGVVGPARTFALDEQLRQVVVSLQPMWEGKGLTVEADLEPVDCTADEPLLRQVWVNLIQNAVKFTEKGGSVAVCLSWEGASARRAGIATVRVRDTGAGIADADLPHVFERFYKGSGPCRARGTGLGLAIAWAVVERCGGTIDARSAPGAGTTMTVELPACAPRGTGVAADAVGGSGMPDMDGACI